MGDSDSVYTYSSEFCLPTSTASFVLPAELKTPDTIISPPPLCRQVLWRGGVRMFYHRRCSVRTVDRPFFSSERTMRSHTLDVSRRSSIDQAHDLRALLSAGDSGIFRSIFAHMNQSTEAKMRWMVRTLAQQLSTLLSCAAVCSPVAAACTSQLLSIGAGHAGNRLTACPLSITRRTASVERTGGGRSPGR